MDVEDAAGDVHEGIHVANNKAHGQGTDDEQEAYRAQSYTSEAGHSNSIVNVWNPSWANGPDKEILRQNAVREAAGRSEAAEGKKKDDPK